MSDLNQFNQAAPTNQRLSTAKKSQTMKNRYQSPDKQNISPSRQIKCMMNQVSKDSPFKRYKLAGEKNSSSEEEEPQMSTDDYATFHRV